MKFQFCGGTSCPQWLIAQISVLTKIVPFKLLRQTAVKMKLILSQLVLNYLQNSDIHVKVTKLLNGTGLNIYECNAVIATLNFILCNSVMFHVQEAILHKELIDLGLPKQNVESITKIYKNNRDKLFDRGYEKYLKNDRNIELKGTIHEFLSSNKLGEQYYKNLISTQKFVQCELNYNDINNDSQQINFITAQDELDELIFQMQDALNLMEQAQNKSKIK